MNQPKPERALANLSWQEVAALTKDPGVVVLPIGAVEQHGPHLPLLTDTLIAEAVLKRALPLLPATAPVWVLPTLPYGKSNEHVGYAGTVSLSATTLLGFVRDVGQSVAAAGFKRLLLFNAHGGNRAPLELIARDLHADLELLVFVASPVPLSPTERDALPELEQRFGIHAGQVETSLILAAAPTLAKPEHAAAHFPALPEGALQLTASPQVAWLTRDWSPQGHFGDPTRASAADGERWLAHAAEQLAALLLEITTFETAAMKDARG